MNGDSSEFAARLQEQYQGLTELIEIAKCSKPKVASNGNYLEIGFSFPIDTLATVQY
jgi:hypothetical protein